MTEPLKPWVRSTKHHTYWNIPREPDTFYQVDTGQDADTLVALKFAVRESPPKKAARPPATAPPVEPVSVPSGPTAEGRPVRPMTVADLGLPPKTKPR